MKLKNVYVGQMVVVKKKAFEYGSLETVYDQLPKNRNAVVESVSSDTVIAVKMDHDSEVWLVGPQELKPLAKPKRYFRFGPDYDGICFVVELTGEVDQSANTFAGTVVLNISGTAWAIGHSCKDWDLGQFSEVKLEVTTIV